MLKLKSIFSKYAFYHFKLESFFSCYRIVNFVIAEITKTNYYCVMVVTAAIILIVSVQKWKTFLMVTGKKLYFKYSNNDDKFICN